MTAERDEWQPPFSRTPRGFEAATDWILMVGQWSFSRTPRGFEACTGSVAL